MTNQLPKRKRTDYSRRPYKGGRTANLSLRIRPDLYNWTRTHFDRKHSFTDWLEEKIIQEQRQSKTQPPS